MRVFELFDNNKLDEIKKGQKDSNGYTRCWPGKHAEGTKKGKNGGQVRNCVPNEGVDEAVNLDRSRVPNYPNDPATLKHRKEEAQRILWDPKSDPDSRREAAAILARMEKQGKA